MISRRNDFDLTEKGMTESTGRDPDHILKKLWLVDDDRNYRASLVELLEGTGEFECSRQFPSAEAVIEALANTLPPDAILLDFNMGGMTGLEALGPIKALVRTTPVLMLTTYSNPTVRALALRSGASDYMLKFYGVEEISARIHLACRTTGRDGHAGATVETGSFQGGPAPKAPSIWPERHATIAGVGRHRSDNLSQAYADQGRPTMRWRSVSLGLARGVRYLRLIAAAVFVRLVQMSFRF